MVYLNGQEAGHNPSTGKVYYSSNKDMWIGMVQAPMKPSDIHREHGTLAGWFALDGNLDELKIYNRALTSEQIKAEYVANQPKLDPDILPRKMPSGPNGPGHFGAYYCKLKYYDGWDDLWPVADDPDVLVRFDKSPVKVVFWRGTRYSPTWVSENGLWMGDQSVETWGMGEDDKEGCFEHMQDRHCLYSHVRIIENTDARVVVHWRYAPVSSHNHLWTEDEKTGWALWVDEYYYIYPDAMGIRNVSWKKGTLGVARQFQESLPFLQPGQITGDVLNVDWVSVGNIEGKKETLSFKENPKRGELYSQNNDFNIQLYNFKSEYKPFILFEPGNQMDLGRVQNIVTLSFHDGCNHWPVGQASCDGRESVAADRPSHTMSFPISDPVIHEKEDRCYWNGLYGMTQKSIEELMLVQKSWVQAPRLSIQTSGFISEGYDVGERAYLISRKEINNDAIIELDIDASKESPLYNPCFVLKNWGETIPKFEIAEEYPKSGDKFRAGLYRTLEGTNLIIWLDYLSTQPVKIKINPVLN